jgi:biopolymer transport protein TolR
LGGGEQGGDGAISGINVTPLVDVMLVLLVIFMVTAPIMTESVGVNLPRTAPAASVPVKSDRAVVVSVTADGSVFLNDDVVLEGELVPRVLALVTEKPDSVVYVRGDESGTYGNVVEVVASLKEAGVSELGLLTRPRNRTGE